MPDTASESSTIVAVQPGVQTSEPEEQKVTEPAREKESTIAELKQVFQESLQKMQELFDMKLQMMSDQNRELLTKIAETKDKSDPPPQTIKDESVAEVKEPERQVSETHLCEPASH